jgi:flagellar biosynthesis protein
MSVTKRAAALSYGAEFNAPKVVASGKGELALSILKKAREYNISIFENEALANSLLSIDIGDEIPPHLYEAVAQVFVWISKAEQSTQLSR